MKNYNQGHSTSNRRGNIRRSSSNYRNTSFNRNSNIYRGRNTNTIGVGSRVIDNNPGWARYRQGGTVVSRTNNTITWKSNTDGKFITDPRKDMILSRW